MVQGGGCIASLDGVFCKALGGGEGFFLREDRWEMLARCRLILIHSIVNILDYNYFF